MLRLICYAACGRQPLPQSRVPLLCTDLWKQTDDTNSKANSNRVQLFIGTFPFLHDDSRQPESLCTTPSVSIEGHYRPADSFGGSAASCSSATSPQPCTCPPVISGVNTRPGLAGTALSKQSAPRLEVHGSPSAYKSYPSLWSHHSLRWASSSAAKAKTRNGSKKPEAASASPRTRTPDWAFQPLELDALPVVMRKRATRLRKLHDQLKAEAAKLEVGGFTAAGKLAAVEAEAQSLPIPPKGTAICDLRHNTWVSTDAPLCGSS